MRYRNGRIIIIIIITITIIRFTAYLLFDTVHLLTVYLQEAQLPQRERKSNIVLSYGAKGTHSESRSRFTGISRWCLSIMHSFLVTSAYIAINEISLKTRFFGLHFSRRLSRSIFNHLDESY